MPPLAGLVYPINALPAAGLTAAGIDQLSHSAELKTAAVLEYYHRLPADLLFCFSDIAIQAEALGANVRFSPGGMPAVSAPAANPRPIRAADHPRMLVNAQVLRALGREFPGRPRAAMVYGPFTVAGQVGGEQAVLRGVVERPEEIQGLLGLCRDLAQDYAALLLETGAEVLWFSDPLAALLPPAAFGPFAGRHLAQVATAFPNHPTVLHVCGDTSQIVSDLLATGVSGISFDQCLELLALEDRLPGDVALIGNLDPVEVLELASPEEVAQETAALAMALGVLPNFSLSTGCAPPPSTPLANLQAFVRAGRQALDQLAPAAPELLALSTAIFQGRSAQTPALVEAALAAGAAPMTVLRAALMRAVRKSGALYETRERHLPEVLMGVDAFNAAHATLAPHLPNAGDGRPRVILGTVAGDLHEIGKNLVRIVLEAHGLPVLDLGVNVAAADFLAAWREHQAPVVGLSAFITSARREIDKVCALLAREPHPPAVIVGGAATSPQVVSQAGAQGYAADAVAAARLVENLLRAHRA